MKSTLSPSFAGSWDNNAVAMSTPSRRAQNRQEKEARILKAATAVFAANGFSATTMDAIAAAAGLSKPTLYQYFASKDDLFSAMLAAPRDAMLDVFVAEAGANHVAQLFSFAESYAATVMRPDLLSLARLIIGEAHRFPEVAQTYQQNGPDVVLARLMQFMVEQRKAGHLTFDDAELAAQDFWGLILSAPRNAALHHPDHIPNSAEISRHIRNGVKVFLRAYATHVQKDLAQLSAIINGTTSTG